MDEKSTLLKNLSAISFSMYDLHLFLDTHPNDLSALTLYNQYKQKYIVLATEYESKFGPISAMNGVSNNQWKWIRSPWPWEYNFNVEE